MLDDGVIPPPAPPPVAFAHKPVTDHAHPRPEAALDVPADVILSWFQPICAGPGRAAKPDLIVPYAVFLVAAVLARGQRDNTIRLDVVATAFPKGLVHSVVGRLHALGVARVDHSAGTITILRPSAAL